MREPRAGIDSDNGASPVRNVEPRDAQFVTEVDQRQVHAVWIVDLNVKGERRCVEVEIGQIHARHSRPQAGPYPMQSSEATHTRLPRDATRLKRIKYEDRCMRGGFIAGAPS